MTGFRVALFLQDRLNDYQAALQAEGEQTARRYGIQLVMHSAERSTELQIHQVRAALAQPVAIRPNAILISPVSELSIMPLTHDAARLGIGWGVLSRWSESITDFRRQYPRIPIFAVLPDHHEIGRIQGRQLRQLISPGDEIVYIQGPIAIYSTRCRRQGLDQELAERMDLRWSRFNGDWSQASGEGAMKSWLGTLAGRKLPEFVIVGQNDNMAMGARQAVLDWCVGCGQRPRGEMRIIGCDGSPTYGQRLVTTQQLSATVYIPPITGQAIELLLRAERTGVPVPAETKVAVRSVPEISAIRR